jgi:hypothetical protein
MPARALIATGLNHDRRARKARGRARRVQRIVDEVAQLVEIQFRVAGYIWDALSPSDVHLGYASDGQTLAPCSRQRQKQQNPHRIT